MALYRQWGAQPGRSRGECPVHLPWVQSFDQFLEDMGPCPLGGSGLRRLDPSLPYRPGNCCWSRLCRKGRPARLTLTCQGETRPIGDWCQLLGLSYNTVYCRIRKGASPAAALGLTQECA